MPTQNTPSRGYDPHNKAESAVKAAEYPDKTPMSLTLRNCK